MEITSATLEAKLRGALDISHVVSESVCACAWVRLYSCECEPASVSSNRVPVSTCNYIVIQRLYVYARVNVYLPLCVCVCVHVQEVKDVSESCGCGLKFEVVVVSPDFEGKGLLARHRLVNGCLAEEIKQIHAFGQKTYTPEQWSSRKNRVADTLN